MNLVLQRGGERPTRLSPSSKFSISQGKRPRVTTQNTLAEFNLIIRKRRDQPLSTLFHTLSKLNRILLLTVGCIGVISAQVPGLTEREKMLLDRIEKLEKRLAVLETPARSAAPATAAVAAAPTVTPAAPAADAKEPAAGFADGTSFNMLIDGYYGFNFNQPHDGINQVRAFDPSHNQFILSQGAIVLERPVNVDAGRRWGGRIDLMFGQTSNELIGSGAFEPPGRSEVYRHLYQAFGSYVAPVGKGLQMDFGRFTTSVGSELVYSKDNYNYTRSFFFFALPYYHTGFKFSYPVGGKLTASYWLMNGTNQGEDFNGLKAHGAFLTWNLAKNFTIATNYYTSQDQLAPIDPGTGRPVNNLAPRGRFHVFDTYFTYTASDKLTLGGQYDYAVNRADPNGPPAVLQGGSAYARTTFSDKFNVGYRFTYADDRGGFASGMQQALKEFTITGNFTVAKNFMIRTELRNDWSDRNFYRKSTPGELGKNQTTALIGLNWWWGAKEGVW